MADSKETKPFYNVGAGNMLRMEIKALGWTRKEFAQKLGFTQKMTNEILKNEIVLTSDIAEKIEQVIEIPSHILLNMDAEYQSRKAKETRPIYSPATIRHVKEM